MRVQVIDSAAELHGITDEWTRLVNGLPFAVPFQLPCWLLTWWKHFGSGELQVLTFWQDGELLSIVPLFRHVWNGRRQLTLIGSGISDWTDPAMKTDVVSEVEEYLAGDERWEVLDWQDLSADTPLRAIPAMTVRTDVPCFEIPLRGTFDDFWNARSKDLRRNLRRYGERARELGSMEFEASTEAKPEIVDALIRLHEARWRKSGEPGMIASNQAEGFLHDAAQQFAARNMLRIFVVRWRDTIAAIVLTFLYRNKIYAYMSAFDPEHEALGFGRMLLYESIRYCFEQGHTAWNFLRGTEPYKASWGAEPIAKIRLYRER